MAEVQEKSFSILCDIEGHVIQILHDEEGMLPPSIIGNMLFSIVVPGDLNKIMNFFVELKKKKSAIGWEINVKTISGAETFSFFGGAFDDRIGIAAAKTKNGASLLFTELTRINNEQVNIIRSLAKEKELLQKNNEETPVSFYEELSRLNNDLVNMQRELAKKNRQLDELNKLKNQFLGMAAHDLRNPLGNIFNFAELLEDESENFTEEQRKFVSIIKSLSNFMVNLVNELLDFSVIESGEVNLNLKKTGLAGLVKQVVELTTLQAAKKSISIFCEIPETKIELEIDAEKISQVITNFLTNALKYSPFNTRIDILITENKDTVRVVVKDQGQGIQQQELDNLFRPFQKTSNQSTGGEKSTGLGLFICKRIVESHGGQIGVNSTVGKGSAFYFVLPKKK